MTDKLNIIFDDFVYDYYAIGSS